MNDRPYWVKRSMKLTDPAMRLAAAKAAARIADSNRIRVGCHESEFWVPWNYPLSSRKEVVVYLSVRLTRDEIEAEFPERPGGGPERRLTEHRRQWDRRNRGHRGGGDERTGVERRGPDRRVFKED